jgi:hypothetical protein
VRATSMARFGWRANWIGVAWVAAATYLVGRWVFGGTALPPWAHP